MLKPDAGVAMLTAADCRPEGKSVPNRTVYKSCALVVVGKEDGAGNEDGTELRQGRRGTRCHERDVHW
jgi:hypothetical protein